MSEFTIRASARLLAALAALAPVAPAAPQQAAGSDTPRSALSGRVLTAAYDGVPVADVWVTDESGAVVTRSMSDGDGYYRMPRLPIGRLVVHAKAAGYVPAAMAVPSAGAVRAATIQLEAGAPLRGDVKWPDGKPVADADVLVRARDSFCGAF